MTRDTSPRLCCHRFAQVMEVVEDEYEGIYQEILRALERCAGVSGDTGGEAMALVDVMEDDTEWSTDEDEGGEGES